MENKLDSGRSGAGAVAGQHQRHVVFVNSSLVCGGAERVISILTGTLASAGSRVGIITVHSADKDHFELDHRVTHLSLGEEEKSESIVRGALNNVRRIRKLRGTIRKLDPSVIVSFQDKNNILALMACAGLPIPVIVSERNDPRRKPIPRVWSFLRWLSYRYASALVVQTRSLTDWGATMVGAEKVHVIPNPVLPPNQNAVTGPRQPDLIVAIGRLVRQKGFDLLLQALAGCAGKWVLEIVGEGPERSSLEGLARDLGLTERVRFVGRVENPWPSYGKASLFVLSSRYEGFPNVLLEAMAHGLPVVSFDCESGPSEIVRNEIDGLLVRPENIIAMSNAIDRLMTNTLLRASFSRRATEVADRFSVTNVTTMWDKLLSQFSAERDA